MHKRFQHGAVSLGEWRHALACVVGWVRCGCWDMCEPGRLLSYWLACALSWHLDLFVAGWRSGRVYNRLQRGAVGLCEWVPALACVVGFGFAVVVELYVGVVGCYRTGWHVLCLGT